MNNIQKVAIGYFLLLGAVVYGYAIGKHQLFPYRYVQEIIGFASWESEVVELSLADKLQNQAGSKPNYFLYSYPDTASTGAERIHLPGKTDVREDPILYIDKDHQSGYRAAFGALALEGSFWGGALISPESEILHTWKLSKEEVRPPGQSDYQMIMYGLHLLPDGSVIFVLHQKEEGGNLIKVDACGNLQWVRKEIFHHTVHMADSGDYIWTYLGPVKGFHHKLVKIDTETGKTLQKIDMKDVYEKNEFTHIFNLQAQPKKKKDASHGNDIDELEAADAAKFPGFEPGDLLLSYRTHHLVFVIDPDTLEVKWWRVGATSRQHDADWEKGFITAFSNNNVGARKGHSDIVRIDPTTMKSDIVVNGESIELYSVINARQELTDYGTRVITSATQGWAVEVDEAGEIVSSFVNTFRLDDKKSSHLSEAYRLPADYFTSRFWEQRCSQPSNRMAGSG